jgi:hypothetical protein
MTTRDPMPLSPALVAQRLEELRALLRLAQSLHRARRAEPHAATPPDGRLPAVDIPGHAGSRDLR